MREYLFRGKRLDNGEWAYGNFVTDATEQVQRENNVEDLILADGFIRRYEPEQRKIVMHEVDRSTVGQYTGLHDKNGWKIFEGDIVDVAYNIEYVGVAKHRMGLFKVIFYKGCFMKKAIPNPQMSFYENSERAAMYHFIPSDETEIVGNIYDNPELLGGETDD